MDRSKALVVFAALAHEARLDLIRLLVPMGDQGMAAGEIARSLGLAASRLSFHLSAMEQAGLLVSRRVARNVFYAVNTQRLGGAVGWLVEDCCMKHPGVVGCSRGTGGAQSELDKPAESPAEAETRNTPKG
ncbi:metalloregulator ArsR/SmtB family transcription factor [Xinfangfangia sp. CPCC 101601]|uniref:Metalloregulator ArsR/SmtB family transcription factor n=1 Tax=Pseudogemmobacter lacusdianii TaxID=3069608 RepID=A0ABU0VYB7_9RHOB|nr:metalloregulator ArsR/SmtB family transcription factor [Xinfangfangia sp. CPCC 101601]MDQ2066623.1 metalloregulator ArsR/SmtB family transcription factor [Xinfangfangia sp. CPCC 101601]